MRDTAFSDRAEAYFGHLKKDGPIAGYRIARHKVDRILDQGPED